MVICSDSLEFLKKQKDYENDVIFADPPYALGSEITIRKDGKVDYAKASDFMNKWEMPTGEYWEKWFIEAYRTLKYGGFLIMYGMDRQLLMFKYYGAMAGFQEQQSIYWYYISNFPKATDLSKMIDKNFGAEREVVAQQEMFGTARKVKGKNGHGGKTSGANNEYEETVIDITAPSTDLAKKYEGYKYSVAPLKQTCETIMVFKKPNKSGSVLHDTLAMENGDDTITCSALNIDENRVATTEKWEIKEYKKTPSHEGYQRKNKSMFNDKEPSAMHENGRYPAQTFIDSQVAEKLDLQSGDIGGCSKILHKCDYEELDFDLFIYEPKVDSGERNNGLYGFEEKDGGSYEFRQDGSLDGKIPSNKNNHPTLKPIDLNYKILKLFKTPNDQRICYPFAGSGSEIIGGLKADFQNWTACEINQDYVDIANARITHYKENEYVQLELF